MSAKKKRVNPNRIPVRKDEVLLMENRDRDSALEEAWSVLFMVMSDKGGYDVTEMQKLWNICDSISGDIANDKREVKDINKILHREAIPEVNYRIPSTKGELAKGKAGKVSLRIAWSILFMALKEYGAEDLQGIWDSCNYLNDSVRKEYCQVPDIRDALREELGISLT